MEPEFTKSEKRRIRELAAIAWERQLRSELTTIGDAIKRMTEHQASPHDINDLIHEFHDGISRELFNRFSGSKPWLAVCLAHIYDSVLTDGDIAGCSDKMRGRVSVNSQKRLE